ncbi:MULTISPECIES: prolyl oligopeptidase family serine peptidase [Antarcticibacterium]|nr:MULTISPECIES: prolyl oligopeptidase family serine peptidase [Antarcticibacterium]
MKRTTVILSIIFLLGNDFSSWGQQEKFISKYPEVQEQEKTEIIFDKKVKDNFPVLNDLENVEVREWFAAQDSLAEKYFSDNPIMKAYLKRFTELQDIQKERISLIKVNEQGNYFYLKYNDSTKIDKLFYKQDLSAAEVELLDPAAIPEQVGDITYLSPSFDGKKIAVGFKVNEEDFDSQVIILDIENTKILKDKINHINPDFGGIEWLPDSSGFIYLYFPVVDRSSPGYKKDSYSVIHFLGQDPEERNRIFGNNENVSIPADYYPKVKIGSSIDDYLIGYSATSNDYYDGYIASMEGILNRKPVWKPFFKANDKVFFTEGEVRNNEFIFRQGTDQGNRIAKVEIKDPHFNNVTVLAEGTQDNPITRLEVTKDNIYFSRSKFGVEVSVFSLNRNEELKELETPFKAGFLSFFGASITENSIGVELDGWTSDYTRYLINDRGVFQEEGLKKNADYPGFDKLVSEQIMISSHDGIEVPLSLVYHKDLEMDVEKEVFMYVYGAYGESLSPFFYPIFLDWALQGGILAFPHVRGGGEKGKDWHIQGMKNLKYNSWKDLIACTEELIDRGFTREGLISLYTVSAGGIAAGMAVNERPDLYASFIAEVPRLHPFGLEAASTTSSTSYLEYGSVRDSLEIQGLINMDPYLNIRPHQSYPAILVMPSYNDDRIPLWDSGKYIAKIQKINGGENPILMDIDFVSGHGTSNAYDETVELYSKIFSFAKSNMKY